MRSPSPVALAVAVFALLAAAPAVPAQEEPVVVYLVRHAEVEPDGTRDPALSEAGRERAGRLASLLGDAGITHVHSTDFRRTQGTAAPAAEAAGTSVASYDPYDLAALAERLRSTPGRHLVLGHSNTTPELVAALGGDPHGEIDESEFDRLYVVIVTERIATTVLLRYGPPSGP